MKPYRHPMVLAAALVAALASGCAELATTGEPYEEGSVGSAGDSGNALAGTAWVLDDSTIEAEAIDRAEVTITFEEAELTGRAPVNTYFGGYTVQGERIEIGELGVTLMAGPEKLMAAEAQYLALLGAAQRFEVGEDLLVLEAEDGGFLAFAPSAAQSTGADHGGDTDIPAQTAALAESLVGMTVEEAEDAVTDAGLAFRVASTDGEAALLTTDYRTDRINVDVEDGEVVAARVG